MEHANKTPEVVHLVVLQADKDGQLSALNHPIVRQFSSEYMLIIAQALKDMSKGIKREAQAKAVLEAQAAAQALS